MGKWPNKADFEKSLESLHPHLKAKVKARHLGIREVSLSEAEKRHRGIMER